MFECIEFYYASSSSGEAYRDRQLTTNFELLVKIFLCADMFPCEDSKTVSVCPSVCPYPEKINHHNFVNISSTLVIDTSLERSSRVLHHGNIKIMIFFFKKFEIWLLTKCWNNLSFVNISHTLVIDASMERFSLVLHYGNPKIWI